jgi:hypothetical protein
MWEWIFFVWLCSIPTWAFLYFAYKFRHCRELFRYLLFRGLLFLVGYGALAALTFPSVSSAISSHVQNWVTSGVSVVFVASYFVAMRLIRSAIKRQAENPEEAERCRGAEGDLFR